MSRTEKLLFASPLLVGLLLVFVRTGKGVIPAYFPEKLLGHTSAVCAVSYSRDGNLLATGSYDGTVRIWDLDTKSVKFVFRCQSAVWSVDFAPDSKVVVSGENNSNITLWNLHTGERIKTWKGHRFEVLSVAFSPAQPIFASGSPDGAVKIWDSNSAALVHTLCPGQPLYAKKPGLWQTAPVTFSPDGKYVVTGAGNKGILTLWDSKNFSRVQALALPNPEKVRALSILSICFSPDSKSLAVVDNLRNISVFDMGSKSVDYQHQGGAITLKFSPNGKKIAYATPNSINIFDTSSRSVERTIANQSWFDMNTLAVAPDGRTLAYGNHDSEVCLWRVSAIR